MESTLSPGGNASALLIKACCRRRQRAVCIALSLPLAETVEAWLLRICTENQSNTQKQHKVNEKKNGKRTRTRKNSWNQQKKRGKITEKAKTEQKQRGKTKKYPNTETKRKYGKTETLQKRKAVQLCFTKLTLSRLGNSSTQQASCRRQLRPVSPPSPLPRCPKPWRRDCWESAPETSRRALLPKGG